MILAAGLSPAWQQILVFDHFTAGEVNRAAESHWYGSGKSLNVAVAAASLGVANGGVSNDCVTVRLLSPIGGPARESIEDEFEERDISARWIGTKAPLRVCTTILDRGTGVTTELVANAPPMLEAELAEFAHEYAVHAAKASVVVMSGSLSAGAPLTFYRDLLVHTACHAILDARGPELLAALETKPLLVKPNREELAKTLQRDLPDEMSLLYAMHELRERGAKWVVVTDGTLPVWVSGPEGNFRLSCPPVEKVVNPIGSGDCFAAGMAVAISQDRDILSAIRYGLGAAADNVGQMLAGRIDPTRVAKLAESVRMETVV